MPEPIQTPVPAADELAAQVLLLAQSRLTADLRFLSSALEQLKPIPVPALDTLFAGDGRCLYYCPETLAQMIVVVEKPEHQNIDINKSFNIENEINNYRNQLKNQNILDVNNKEYDYQMGVYYMDIIAECEKLGDYVVNVVEASSDVKEKKAS